MRQSNTNILKNIGVTLLTILLFTTSCSKTEDYIPEVLFNFYIDLNSVEYNSLKIPTNSEYLNYTGAGFRGVIIHCNFTDEYVAFDRACPYHPDNVKAVVEIGESQSATCPECGSEFNLFDGSVLKGPSARPLKLYHTNLQGSLLYVYN